jgi:hypothetical protein
MTKGIQIVVKFQKDNSVYVNFESCNKHTVDWDSISDEEYIDMMNEAIRTITNWRNQYIHGNKDSSTQMSNGSEEIDNEDSIN